MPSILSLLCGDKMTEKYYLFFENISFNFSFALSGNNKYKNIREML